MMDSYFRPWLRLLTVGLAQFGAIDIQYAHGACITQPADLVSWWRGNNDGSDFFGNNHGSLRGGLGFSVGQVGNCFNFTANGQAVRMPASASLNVGTNLEFSIEAWIKPVDAVNQYPIVEWNNGNPGAHFWINVNYAGFGGPGALYASLTPATVQIVASAPGVIMANSWQHVALTYQVRFRGDEIKLFHNGVEVASRNVPSAAPQTGYDLHIGARPGTESFRGQIDEVSLYTRALSASEIQALYQAGAAGKCDRFVLTNLRHSGVTTSFDYRTRRDFYYIDYFGLEATDITGPFSMDFGTGWSNTTTFNAGVDLGFFRAGEVPISTPLDSDHDGIDDVYEMRQFLRPLDPTDALQDPDRDGRDNQMEYSCHSDPFNHYNGVFPLEWYVLNGSGIRVDAAQNAWHAGLVKDVLLLDASSGDLLAATETGGAWLITQSGAATPLSDDWDQPDLSSLAFGPDGPQHIFAAGRDLYETDVTTASPLNNWRRVGVPLDYAYRIVVISGLRRIVAVGDFGVWWSPIPNRGVSPSGYSWTLAQGLPIGTYSGLALGPDNTVIAGAFGSQPVTGLYGLWRGVWSNGELVFSRATIAGADATQLYRMAVASCDADRNFAYAIAGADSNFVHSVFKTTDGGQNWTACSRIFEDAPPGYDFSFVAGNQANSRNLCIAVAPNDPNRVAFGARRGPFVSSNGGNTWRADAHTWRPSDPNNPPFRTAHQHADLHGLYFDPSDPAGQRLYVCSDGGLIRTPDLGLQFSSVYNLNLADIQVYNGDLGVVNLGQQTLVGIGTQDNGNPVCYFDPSIHPWFEIDYGFDGGLMRFLHTGDLLHNHSGNGTVRRTRWDTSSRSFGADSIVPILPAAPSGATALDNPVMENVDAPNYRNASGELLYAVAGRQAEVYGLFADDFGANLHWQWLATLPISSNNRIQAIGSYDGGRIYAAAGNGSLFAIATAGGAVTSNSVAAMGKFAFLGPNLVFGYANSGLFRTLDGVNWARLVNGVPFERIVTLTADATTTPGTVFAATDDRVYLSHTRGDTWKLASSRLPRRPHATDLRVLSEYGKRNIYLSTYGRSVWRAQLADYSRYPLTGRGTSFSGNYIQSTWGQSGDFELLVPRGRFVFHYSRENYLSGSLWVLRGCLKNPRVGPPFSYANPGAVALIQSRLGNAGYPGTLEAVVRSDAINGSFNGLDHYYYDGVSRDWYGPDPIVADGQNVSGVTGEPALIQSTFGANGDYQLLVPIGDRVAHFWRDNDVTGYPWHRAPDLPRVMNTEPPFFVLADPLDVAFLQGNFGPAGNLEAIVRVRPRFGGSDYLVFYYFDSGTFRWNGPFNLVADGMDIAGVTGPPALIQGTWGTVGNFELLVPMGDRIAHFYRDNDAGFAWHRNPDLPRLTADFGFVLADPIAVGFLQSSYSPAPGVPGFFEVVARVRPRFVDDDDYLVTYTFDSLARRWTGPTELQVDGKTVSAISGF